MGRLVDIDKVIKAVDKRTKDEPEIVLDDDITCILEEVPTACDIEKVIKLVNRRIEFLDATSKLFAKEGKSKEAEINAIRLKEVIALKEVIRKGGIDNE